MRRSLLLIVPSLLILSLFLTAPGGPPSPLFTHGLASGDVTDSSAVLWTRVGWETKLTLEVSTNDAFPKKDTIRRSVVASAENGFTAKELVDKLKPDDTYFYRFRRGGSASEVGTFRTADRPT